MKTNSNTKSDFYRNVWQQAQETRSKRDLEIAQWAQRHLGAVRIHIAGQAKLGLFKTEMEWSPDKATVDKLEALVDLLWGEGFWCERDNFTLKIAWEDGQNMS